MPNDHASCLMPIYTWILNTEYICNRTRMASISETRTICWILVARCNGRWASIWKSLHVEKITKVQSFRSFRFLIISINNSFYVLRTVCVYVCLLRALLRNMQVNTLDGNGQHFFFLNQHNNSIG